MADTYDGSVIIDTELDSSGFEKGSDKLKAAMRGVTNALDSIAENAARAFQEPIKAPEIAAPDDSGLEAAITEFEKHEKELAKAAKKVFEDADASELTEQYQSAENAADRLAERQKALRKLIQEKEDDAFAESHAASEKTFVHYASVIERNVDAVAKALDRMQRASETGFRNFGQVLAQNAGLDATAQKIQTLRQALEELGEYQLLDEEQQERFEDMRAQLEHSEKALNTNSKLIRQEQIEQARLNVLAAQEKVAAAETEHERRKALDTLQKTQNQLAAAAQKSVTSAPDPKAASAWQRFGGIMKNTGSIAKRAGSMTLKGFTLPLKGVKALASGTIHLLSRMRKSGSGADGLVRKLTGLKTMLTSRIKRTFINFLFEQIQESFKALAQFDSRFDRSVSNMRNGAKELGANIMGALGGIVRDLEPYITAMIGKASDAVTKINAAISALRGESTMQIAVRQTESYAASLDSAAASAENAKSAQDKLNRTLTSYDEIHKLDESNTADSADDASRNENVVFQTVAVAPVFSGIDESVQNLIRQAKDAIRRGDWRGVGKTIADGFHLAVGMTDSTIHGARDRVLKGVLHIADALNGLTDQIDSYLLGQTIADGLNLGLDTAYAFLTRYDFGKFGLRTAQGFNGLFDGFDSDGHGRTLAAGFNAVFDFGYQAVSNFQWRKCGTKLGTSVNSFIQNADWSKAAHTFSEGIKGIFDGAIGFIEETDWEQAGDQFAEFFTELDYAGIASKIAEGIGGAIGGVGAFLRGIFRKLAEKGTAWGEHLFDECKDEIEAAGGSIGDAVWIGVKYVFSNSWKKAKEYIFQPFIKGFKKAFGISSPAKEMKPYGEYVGEGVFEGIRGVFSAPANWIRTNIAEPFKRGFAAAFNVVGGKATALLENGKSIANGVKNGISIGWSSVNALLAEKAIGARSCFTPDQFKKLGETIVGGICNGLNDDRNLIEKIDSLKIKISESIDAEGIKAVGKNILHIMGWGVGDDETYNKTIGKSISELAQRISASVDVEKVKQTGRDIAWILDNGIEDYLRTTPSSKLNGIAANWVEAAKEQAGLSEKSYLAGSLQRAKEIANTIEKAGESEVQMNAGERMAAEAKMLDTVADKLAAIAQMFQTINRAFTDFTRVPLPAIVAGTYAPPRTRYSDTDESAQGLRRLFDRFFDRAAELEEIIINRPIRVDVRAEIDKREIARATAEVRQDTNNINNGNGGRW